MGTNYYVRSNACHCCGRYDEHHIGKSLTMFEARGRWEVDGEWTVEVGSWADWRNFLRTNVVEIRDEYGEQHEVEDFIADVENVPVERRSPQYEWMVANQPSSVSPRPAPGMDWLDADGFSFSAREFS